MKAKDGTRLPRRRRCKGEDVAQVLATGKRCGTRVIDGSSLRVVHGEPDGTPSSPACVTSLSSSSFSSFPAHRARVRFVVFFFLFLLLLPRKRLRIRCAARLSNQEILVTLPLPQLGKLDGHARFR